jgi:predicted permease
MMLTGTEGAESIRAVWVTPNFFDFMGLPPLVGRLPGAQDARPDAPPVAVLRHRAWMAYFGADPSVVGRTILLDGEPRTVIGVMPPRFTWHAADVWLPKAIERAAAAARTVPRNFQARLKHGVTLEAAQAQLSLIAARRAEDHPDEYPKRFQVQVVNVIEYTVGGFSTVLYVSLAAVGLLLLIACCNVANMLLARATARDREMTVRAALGAGRSRIVRQLLVESLLIGMAGAAAGCLLAYLGLDALVAVLPPAPLPGEVEIALDGAALGVALATAVVSALLFGLAPALYSARGDLVEGLKGGGPATAGGRRNLLRHALVTAEIALSLVLLLGAGLLMRTFVSLVRVDVGFDPAKVLFVPVAFPPGAYANPAEKHQFYERAMQRIAALPGVEAVSASTVIPPDYGPPQTELEALGAPATRLRAIVQSCTEDCFRTLGIRILRGRALPALPADAVPRVAVVNLTFVSSLRGADPIGRHFKVVSPDAPGHSVEVVGIVEDVKNQGIRGATVPQVYLPGATAGRAHPVMLVRARTEPHLVVNALRREVALVDSRVALVQPRTIQEILERWTYAQPRFSLIVLGIFALSGTLLVAVGVFSVMAYTVSRRRKEIAVRVALGAGRAEVLRVVFGLGLRLIAAGAAIGLLASAGTGRLIASQLWNTSPHDPLTFVAATSAIAVIVLAGCYIPARRAIRIDPMLALRQE